MTRLDSHRECGNYIKVDDKSDLSTGWGTIHTFPMPPSATENEQERQKNTHKWLDCVDRFADKIQGVDIKSVMPSFTASESLPRSLTRDVVVAVIDDGVDISHRVLRGKIHGGRSCDTSAQGHYRISANNHGTTMACMIVRVCPRAKIYVIKLQTHLADSELRIDASSAAKVSDHFQFSRRYRKWMDA